MNRKKIVNHCHRHQAYPQQYMNINLLCVKICALLIRTIQLLVDKFYLLNRIPEDPEHPSTALRQKACQMLILTQLHPSSAFRCTLMLPVLSPENRILPPDTSACTAVLWPPCCDVNMACANMRTTQDLK